MWGRETGAFLPAYHWVSGGRVRLVSAAAYEARALRPRVAARAGEPRSPKGQVVTPGRGPVRSGWEPPLPEAGRAEGHWRYEYPVGPYARDILGALASVADGAGYGSAAAMEPVVKDYFGSWLECRGLTAGGVVFSPSRSQAQRLVALESASGKCRERVGWFVSRYGELVRDFGSWCARVGGQRWEHPNLSYTGHEARWWGEWARWALAWERRRARAKVSPEAAPIAAPVSFYLWAAVMLTALRRHPEWPGCQVFLANRAAGLRLHCGGQWLVALLYARKGVGQAEEVGPRGVAMYGDLLDYLGAAAGVRGWQDRARPCANPDCGALFVAGDRRRRYCADCSNPRTRARLWAREHYRAKTSRPAGRQARGRAHQRPQEPAVAVARTLTHPGLEQGRKSNPRG